MNSIRNSLSLSQDFSHERPRGYVVFRRGGGSIEKETQKKGTTVDKGGKYAFFSILVGFLDATKRRTSSAPIRFDRWLELFLPTARLKRDLRRISLLRKQSGRKENRSVWPSGNFRIAIIEARVDPLLWKITSYGSLSLRTFLVKNDSKIETRVSTFLAVSFFERAIICENYARVNNFNV